MKDHSPVTDVLERQGVAGQSINNAELEARRIIEQAALDAKFARAQGQVDAAAKVKAVAAKRAQQKADMLYARKEKLALAQADTGEAKPETDPLEGAVPQTFDINTMGPGPSPGRFAPTSVADAAALARGGAGVQSRAAAMPGGFPVTRPQQGGPESAMGMPGGPAGPLTHPSVTVGGQAFQAPPMVGTLRATRQTDYERTPTGRMMPVTRYGETFDVAPNVLTPGDILRARQEEISQATQRAQYERTLRINTFTELNKDYPEYAGKLTQALVTGDGPAIDKAFAEAGPSLTSKVMQEEIKATRARAAASYAAAASENEQTALYRLQREALQADLDAEHAGDVLLQKAGMPGVSSWTFSSGKSAKGKSATDLLGIADDIYDKDNKVKDSRMMDATMLQSALLRKGIVYSIEGAETGADRGLFGGVKQLFSGTPAGSGAYRLDSVINAMDIAQRPKPTDPAEAKEWREARDFLTATGIFDGSGDGNLKRADNHNDQIYVGLVQLYRNLSTTESKTGGKSEVPEKLASQSEAEIKGGPKAPKVQTEAGPLAGPVNALIRARKAGAKWYAAEHDVAGTLGKVGAGSRARVAAANAKIEESARKRAAQQLKSSKTLRDKINALRAREGLPALGQ